MRGRSIKETCTCIIIIIGHVVHVIFVRNTFVNYCLLSMHKYSTCNCNDNLFLYLDWSLGMVTWERVREATPPIVGGTSIILKIHKNIYNTHMYM